MREMWRPVIGWEKWYSVSSRGRVRREKPGRNTWPGRILSTRRRARSYPYIKMVNGNHEESRYLHRIVLESFRGMCPKGMEARHMDDNKLNDNLSNLKWGTHKQNFEDVKRNGILFGLAKLPPKLRSAAAKKRETTVSSSARSSRTRRGWYTRRSNLRRKQNAA